MADNKYCNLIPTNKIKDEFIKLNPGFSAIEADVIAIEANIDTIETDIVTTNGNVDTINGDITTIEEDIDTHKLDLTAHGETLSIYRSNKDSSGIFTIIEYKRADATLAKTSILSGGTGSLYTTRTEVYYGLDGETVLSTKIYTLIYDINNDLISGVLN